MSTPESEANTGIGSIEKLIETTVRRTVKEALSEQQGTPTEVVQKAADRRAESGIGLWELYDVKGVADVIGIEPGSVYDIPENELKPTWVGSGRGSKKFLGMNLLCYVAGIDPVDVEAVAHRRRRAFLQEAKKPPVDPKPSPGRRRIC